MSVSAGSTLGIVGPSGVGKSTLLAIVGGILRPTVGEVLLEGSPVTPDSVAARCAWVPQTLNLLLKRSVLDNVTMIAKMDSSRKYWGEIERSARLVLDSVGLSDFESVPAGRLSGGEAQRVCIARALASSRPIILADEPTGQLDRVRARMVARLLAGDSAETRAAVLVTHDLEVSSRCTAVVDLAAAAITA